MQFKNTKEMREYFKLKAKYDAEAQKSEVEYKEILIKKYRDEHPTENEANRIHAGAPCDDPEGELTDDIGIHPQDMRI